MVACYGFEKVELHYTQNLRILNNHYAFIKHAQVHLKSIHHEISYGGYGFSALYT